MKKCTIYQNVMIYSDYKMLRQFLNNKLVLPTIIDINEPEPSQSILDDYYNESPLSEELNTPFVELSLSKLLDRQQDIQKMYFLSDNNKTYKVTEIIPATSENYSGGFYLSPIFSSREQYKSLSAINDELVEYKRIAKRITDIYTSLNNK